MVEFACAYCGAVVQADEGLRGQKVECEACGHRVVVPRVVSAPAVRGGESKEAGKTAMGMCPECFTAIPARAMRCSACGASFLPVERGEVEAATAETVADGEGEAATTEGAIETSEPMVEWTCSKCKAELSAPRSQAGEAIRCPQCGLHETVPKKRFSLRERLRR